MRRAIKDLDSDATEDEGNGIPSGSASQKESAPSTFVHVCQLSIMNLVRSVEPYLTQSSLGHKHTRSLSRQVSMESIGSTCTCILTCCYNKTNPLSLVSRSSSRQSTHQGMSLFPVERLLGANCVSSSKWGRRKFEGT